MSKGNLYNLEYISSQVISGGHITTGYNATTNYDIINKEYFDAHGSVPSDLNVTTISSSKISGGTLLINTLTLDANIISGLIDPPYPSAAATKHYVDTYGAGALSGPMVGTIGANYDFGISGLAYISSQVISGGNYLGSLHYPFTYVVYSDGTNYYAKNCENGQITYSGASPMIALQTALDNSVSGSVKLLSNIPALDGGVSGTRGCLLDLGMNTIKPGSQFNNGIGSNKCMFNMIGSFSIINGTINVADINFKDNDVFLYNGRYPSQNFGNPTNSFGSWIQNIKIRGKTRYADFATCSGTAVHLYAGDNQSICTVSVDNVTADYLEYFVKIQCYNDGALGYINGNRFSNLWGTYCSNFFWISCNSAPTTSTSAAGANRFENFNFQAGPPTHKVIYCNGGSNYFNGFIFDDYACSSETGLPATGTDNALYEFFSGNKANTTQYYGMSNYIHMENVRIGDPHVYVHDSDYPDRVWWNIFVEETGGTGRNNSIRTDGIYTNSINCTGAVYNSRYLYINTGYTCFRNIARNPILTLTDLDTSTDTYLSGPLTNFWLATDNDHRLKLTTGGTDNLMYIPKGRSFRLIGNWSSSDYGIGLYAITGQDSVIDGGTTTKDCLTIKANSADTYPFIYMSGSSGLGINQYNTSGFSLNVGTKGIFTTAISSSTISGGIVKTAHISSTTWDVTIAALKALTDGSDITTSYHTHSDLGGVGGSGGFPSGTTGSIQYRSGNAHAGGERLLWDMTNNKMIISGGISLSGGKVGIGTMYPSTGFHVMSGASFGPRTLTPQALITVELTDNDSMPTVYQAIKMQSNRNGGATLYGFNGTSIGANDRNVGLYSYAEEATVNYGLWVDAGQTRLDDRVGIGIQPEDSAAEGFLLYVATGGIYTKSLSSQAISANTILCSTFNVNASIISGLVDPVYPSAAANKHYVDSVGGVTLESLLDDFYPSSLGKAVSGGLFDHVSNDAIHGGGGTGGPMTANIGANGEFGISGIAYISANTGHISGCYLSGLTMFQRTDYPVCEIRRNTALTGTLIDGVRFRKAQLTAGADTAGGGIGFVFEMPDSAGTNTIYAKFGGVIAQPTNGTEIGQIGFAGVYQGADIVTTNHLVVRAVDATYGDVYVEHALGVGKYPTSISPLSNALEVSGNALFYSGNTYIRHGYVSGQHMTPIARGAGKPAASEANEGIIYRTSGTSTNKSYVWICLRNSAGSYEWVQLGVSS